MIKKPKVNFTERKWPADAVSIPDSEIARWISDLAFDLQLRVQKDGQPHTTYLASGDSLVVMTAYLHDAEIRMRAYRTKIVSFIAVETKEDERASARPTTHDL